MPGTYEKSVAGLPYIIAYEVVTLPDGTELVAVLRGGRDWTEHVKGLLKAELKRRNVGYRELAEKLGALGIHETERNIANKISPGGFTAAFFMQCLVAVGCHTLRLEDG